MNEKLTSMKESGLSLLKDQVEAIKNSPSAKDAERYNVWACGANAMLKELGLISNKESLEVFDLIQDTTKERIRRYHSND